jgi:hypothetical protein
MADIGKEESRKSTAVQVYAKYQSPGWEWFKDPVPSLLGGQSLLHVTWGSQCPLQGWSFSCPQW